MCGARDRAELVGDAQPRNDPVDLVVEVHGTGLRVDVGPPVQHEAVDAVLREQRCGGDAGRSRADDDDGDPSGTKCHPYLTTVR